MDKQRHEIQRCDGCNKFDSDEEAYKALCPDNVYVNVIVDLLDDTIEIEVFRYEEAAIQCVEETSYYMERHKARLK